MNPEVFTTAWFSAPAGTPRRAAGSVDELGFRLLRLLGLFRFLALLVAISHRGLLACVANSADYAPALQAVASAWAKSATRSAWSSMPTETRTRESAIPISARRAGPISQ